MSALTRIIHVSCAALLALPAMQAAAQDAPRPGYGPSVNTATAKKIAAGVIAEC